MCITIFFFFYYIHFFNKCGLYSVVGCTASGNNATFRLMLMLLYGVLKRTSSSRKKNLKSTAQMQVKVWQVFLF